MSRLIATLLIVALAAACSSDPVSEAPTTTTTRAKERLGGRVAAAELSDPIAGQPVTNAIEDLASAGYVEQERFASGRAASFTSAEPLTADGRWTLARGEEADYTTRVLVRRPAKAADASGTVIVEWFNVTAGADTAPNWAYVHDELMREGHVWVGVSAQQRGVDQLRSTEMGRYGPLAHPGDSFSYDIFSQVGEALRQADSGALDGIDVRRIVAVGASQSAFRLTTYVDGMHPLAEVYDGFLVHSRAAGASAVTEGPQGDLVPPRPVIIRTDLDQPVLIFQTEGDIGPQLKALGARQDDTDGVVTWEAAGVSHADAAILEANGAKPDGLGCDKPVNSGPHAPLLRAAVHHLVEWVDGGDPPPGAPRLEVVDGNPPSIVRDDLGNARGGLRTPAVDVPIAALTGEPNTGPSFCFLFGTTAPFDEATIARLYPTHDAYVSAYRRSANAAARAGYLLRVDADAMIAAAEASSIGR